MEKITLLKFFEVLSGKIRCCFLSKRTIYRSGFFGNGNVEGLNSRFNGSETHERSLNLSVPQIRMPTRDAIINFSAFIRFE